ncbi:uncharacterized protein PAC_07402 [Phialocephala subalpina]|uniref:Zn(2)-C6 fungal-type domain-containing protein n=1 Tax=Phialocephala subalpina TaxID=576137 RepID=A0A1L7WXK8_9HELO|nr:uncharacterized protein PAC_07402 [Phialocephala subalpina]
MSALEQVVKKSAKGCWTCKRRKIGCDKILPSCSNCLRTKRTCEGYGLKLAWPEDGDGRRPDNPNSNGRGRSSYFFLSSNRRGSVYFLNTSEEDLQEDVKRPLPVLAIAKWHFPKSNLVSVDPSRSLSFGYETSLKGQELSVLSYYTDVLSRMVTTIDDAKNGFRNVLLPMALSDANNATAGLRQAMLAISAYHLWGHDAAINYKLSAIRYLSKSLHNGEEAPLPQFTTCMVLCIGDVFDSADGSWPKHLAAAKALSKQLHRHRDQTEALLFLQTWLEYHVVLEGFSSGQRQISDSESSISMEPLAMPLDSSADTIIIGALGCSRELMNLISLITRLHGLVPLPPHLEALPTHIQIRLQNLIQTTLLIPDARSGYLDTNRIFRTAELYRLASLIYLHTTLVPLPRSSAQLQSLVSQSLRLLETFEVCTSPWPLFVTAIEVNNDADRVRVLHVLEVMQKVRRIGNVDVLQRIVEVLWGQMDLRSDNGQDSDERLDWRDFFHLGDCLPSFI